MLHQPRILIADDEEALLRSLAQACRDQGYEVDTAPDGSRAWEELSQNRYDLVVTDLRMPGLDGPELMGRIAERAVGTRVVVITGHATLAAAVDCLRKGAIDFLMKPFEIEDFLASVAKALGRPLPPGSNGLDWDAAAKRFRLTLKQRQVLETFYSTGKGNRELGILLDMSPHTVKSHLRAAYMKMGVSNRTHLLQKLRETP